MKLFWNLLQLKFGLLACSLILAMVVLGGCSSPSDSILFSDNPVPPAAVGTGGPNMAPAAPDSNDSTAARFHVGDTVTVDYSGTPDKLPENVQTVTEEGSITLPYIGTIRAVGLSAGELQKEIHDLYVPRYYTQLTVTVTGVQRVFYVGGEVKLPGRQQYIGEITVTKAIQSAGDFTDFANRKNVKLIRANGQVIKVNCTKAAQDPSLDPPVYPGDQILVSRRIF